MKQAKTLLKLLMLPKADLDIIRKATIYHSIRKIIKRQRTDGRNKKQI